MSVTVPDWLDSVAGELQISQDELISQGIRVLLENKLQEEEDGSWQDFQRLDTLEYKRDRLHPLLERMDLHNRFLKKAN
ncbi:MAG: hypothetical protein KDD84_13815 [Caldilineaceae bacterium]|nr:hypothetical protein [Caldilineaceae bacterium]